jgi:hypothetical protein
MFYFFKLNKKIMPHFQKKLAPPFEFGEYRQKYASNHKGHDIGDGRNREVALEL